MNIKLYDMKTAAEIIGIDYEDLILALTVDGLIWKSQKGYKPYKLKYTRDFFVLIESTDVRGKRKYETKLTESGLSFLQKNMPHLSSKFETKQRRTKK